MLTPNPYEVLGFAEFYHLSDLLPCFSKTSDCHEIVLDSIQSVPFSTAKILVVQIISLFLLSMVLLVFCYALVEEQGKHKLLKLSK